MSYDAIITAAAAELERRQRATPSRLYVVAHPTTAERDGFLAVITDADPSPAAPAQIIRPRRADGISDWRAIPYQDYRHHLWHGCRSAPILPIPRNA